MLLHQHFFDLHIGSSHVLIRGAYQRDAGKIVVGLQHQRALDGDTGRRQRTRRNLHALPTPQLSARFLHLRLIEIWYEVVLLTRNQDGVAPARRSHGRLVQRQVFAVLQKTRLQEARRKNLKFRRLGSDHDGPAVAHLHIDLRGMRRRGLRLLRWFGTTRQACSKPNRKHQKEDRNRTSTPTNALHTASLFSIPDRYSNRKKT